MAQQLPESFNGGQNGFIHSPHSCAAIMLGTNVQSCVSTEWLENFTSQFCQSSIKASFNATVNRKYPDPNLARFNADDEPMCPCRLMLSDTLNGRSRSNLILCLLIIVRQSISTTQRHRKRSTTVRYISTQVLASSEVNYRSEHC